ncbi:MAG: ATP12 family protein, partial [Pseudomonadota bacterium]
MSEWAAKRFWKTTATTEVDGGYAIELDGRAVKTPAKSALVLPTAAMAAE